MIPKRLCTDETSLAPGEKRAAVITRFTVTPDGKLSNTRIWRAFVVNKHKLAYNAVSAWLNGNGRLDVPSDVQVRVCIFLMHVRVCVCICVWLTHERRHSCGCMWRPQSAWLAIGA